MSFATPSRRGLLLPAAALFALAAAGRARAAATPFAVVSESESALPNAPPPPAPTNLESRGLFRPPDIEQVLPRPGTPAGTVFPLKIDFKAHQGSTVDPSTIRVTYLKVPAVDLTERLRAYISADGIFIPSARFPPGAHLIRVQLADTDHNPNEALFTLLVR